MKAKSATQEEIRAAATAPLPEVVKPAPKRRKKHRLIPRNEWVLIRKTSLDEEVSDAGIILNRDNVKLHQGVIVEAGAIARERGLSIGLRVMYTAFGMDLDDIELLTGDENLFLIREEEVYSAIEELDEYIETLETLAVSFPEAAPEVEDAARSEA